MVWEMRGHKKKPRPSKRPPTHLEDVPPVHRRSALEGEAHVGRRPVQPGAELVQGRLRVHLAQVGGEAAVQQLHAAVLAEVHPLLPQLLLLCRVERGKKLGNLFDK